MKTPLDALYDYARQQDDLARWLFNDDIAETYREATAYAHKQQLQLLDSLAPGDLERYRKFLENSDEAHELDGEILFCQGLSIGLRLGALARMA